MWRRLRPWYTSGPRRAARRRRTTMTIQRMDNVGIVVDDLDAAVAFFTELGMELEGQAQIEGLWADRTVGLDGVRSDIAMMRTPDGHSKLELSIYEGPYVVKRFSTEVDGHIS